MSLENKIGELTAAVAALTAALVARGPVAAPAASLEPAAAPAKAETPAEAEKPAKAPKTAKTQKGAENPTSAPDAAASQPSATPAASDASATSDTTAGPVDYETVRLALTAVATKHGRQLAVDCLSRVGATNAKGIAPELYEKALAVFTQALETGSV